MFEARVCPLIPANSLLDTDKFGKKRSAFDEAVLDEEDSLDNLSTGRFDISISREGPPHLIAHKFYPLAVLAY